MPRSNKVEFTGSSGSTLAAALELPDGPVRDTAIFAHCFTCSKNTIAATRISRELAAIGVVTLRFDFTGLGGSQGDFANTNFSSNVQDIVQAANFIESEYSPPRLLIGHSLGGAAVISAAVKLDNIRAVATIGAPCDPRHVQHILDTDIETIESTGEATVTIAGRSFKIRKQFLDDIREQQIHSILQSLRKALLIFHSPQDQIVNIENARWIFESARHPKSFVSLDKADHLLTSKSDATYVARTIAAWASRYVSSLAEESSSSARPTTGQVMVEEIGDGKFRQRISTARHNLIADEPKKFGGDYSGLSPYDLVLAGLGACTSMTLRMYADRKEWPLDGVTVELSHDKIHAEDCKDYETETGKLDYIERVIRVKGDLTSDQKERLLEIANKCPVHRSFQSEIKVDSKLGP